MLLKVLLITACLVASAYGGCNMVKRLKIKAQWSQTYGHGSKRESLGDDLWTNFFKKKPDAREKFFNRVRGDNVYSHEFMAHGQRVLGGVDFVVSLMDDQEAFEAALTHLKVQHSSLGIGAEYNTAFKEAIMEAVAHQVGRCFDQDAWNACLDIIMTGIQS